MSERIAGTVYIMNAAGDPQREVDVPIGSSDTIEGEFGSLVVDATVRPPRLHGKGNIFLNFGQGRTRSGRLNAGETVQVELVDGFNAGSLTFQK